MEFNLGIPFSIFTQKTQSLTLACDLVIKSQKVKRDEDEARRDEAEATNRCRTSAFIKALSHTRLERVNSPQATRDEAEATNRCRD